MCKVVIISNKTILNSHNWSLQFQTKLFCCPKTRIGTNLNGGSQLKSDRTYTTKRHQSITLTGPSDAMMERYSDFSQKVFVFINFDLHVEVKELKVKVKKLGGQFVENDISWDPKITHIVSNNFKKAEIVLAGKNFFC